MLNRLIAPFRKNHIVAPFATNRPNAHNRGVSRVFTLFVIFVMLAQVLFIGPVRKADAKAKAPAVDTSSPAEPFVINTPPTFAGTVISGVSSLLGLVAPTTAKEASPKTEESAVEPPSPSNPPAPPMMSSATPAQFAALRLLPGNATGGTDLYSRNFGWGTSLVGLPGRAGLDAGFGISYNSLVWLKDTTNSEIVFDPDLSNVSPGFHIGLPEIEKIYNTGGSGYSFLMVNPDGSRTEFRRVGTTSTFETGDSSYRQLVISTGAVTSKAAVIEITVTSTDGTMMHYIYDEEVSRYLCQEIKDRNGNIISVGYTGGRLSSIEDTLGRTITINHDGGGYPTTIEQTWKDTNGSGSNTTHTWATLSYTNVTVSTSFSGLTVVGPANSTTVKALEKITYADGSFTKFEYNGYVQVKKISQVAADSTSHILNYVTTDLASVSGSQTDCPRFGETKTWVENFNLSGGTPQEVVVTNSITTGATYSLPNSITGSATRIDVAMTGHPDGLYTRTYVGASGYKEGLTLATEDCTGSNCATRLRWTWNDWTQDNTGVSYITNPRVTESRVGDGTNTKKTTIDYGSNGYGLPEEVKVYDTDLSTVLKTQTTTYELGSTYTNRRIIGLPSETKLWQGTTSGTLMSKVTYAYDYDDDFAVSGMGQNNTGAVQHDDTNYGATFSAGRGNLTSVKRWDATDPTDAADAVTSTILYNITGAVVAKTDPLSRTVKIDYTDNFNSSPGVTTYAYPKRIYDPAGNYSEIKYRYDIGANVEATSPAPAGQTYGKKSKRLFDSIGRLDRQSIYVNTTEKAYTRYEYPTNGIQSKVFSTIIDMEGDGPGTDDEVLSESWFDGAGRGRRSRTEHPGSTGGWSGTQTEYDVLGRTYRKSVPTEISVSGTTWTPAGDDSTRGWIWNYQEYDWKGRVTRTIPSDSTGSDGKDTLITYAGCGCAGGQVTTVSGPVTTATDVSGSTQTTKRRTSKSYEDILGRTYKTETWDLDGAGTYPYSTVKTTFNGRDQATLIRQYAGSDTNTTYQDTTMSYDGHGRLITRHEPRQNTGTATTYTYFADDSLETKADARGATKHFSYNSRGLVDGLSWTVPYGSGIDVPGSVSFEYDNAGNRTEMEDGLGTVEYVYNSLSQITSETRELNDAAYYYPDPISTFQIQYTYNLSGQLATLTEPFGEVVTYSYDKVGRSSGLSGNRASESVTLDYLTSTSYRAWGGIKTLASNDNQSSTNYSSEFDYNNRLQPTSYSQKENSTTTLHEDYQYYNDGMLKFSSPATNSKFDRSYGYDFQGRMLNAKTGAEARGGTESNATQRPYRTTFEYDHFGNTTSQTRLHYISTFTDTFEYENDRNTNATSIENIPDWVNTTTEDEKTFDADGREIGDTGDGQLYKYDADGRLSSIVDARSLTNTYPKVILYDGDGNRAKISQQINLSTTWHQNAIFSFVTGTEITNLGQRFESGGIQRQTKYYAGGSQVAERRTWIISSSITYDITVLLMADPSGKDRSEKILHYDNAGAFTYLYTGFAFLDPLGAGIGIENPYPTEPPPTPEENCTYFDGEHYDCLIDQEEFPDPDSENAEAGSVPRKTAYVDGFEMNLQQAMHLVALGLADVDWKNSSHSALGDMGIVQNPIYLERSVKVEGEKTQTYQDIIGYETEVIGDDFTIAKGQSISNNPCELMAQSAQNIINNLKNYPDLSDKQKLEEFARVFQTWYTGGWVGTSNLSAAAWNYITQDTNGTTTGATGTYSNLAYNKWEYHQMSGRALKLVVGSPYRGQKDFKSLFRQYDEKEKRGDGTDQTHHFAAYFALGAAGLDFAAWARQEDSPPDKFLGDKAFNLGDFLRRNPSELKNFAFSIRTFICESDSDRKPRIKF